MAKMPVSIISAMMVLADWREMPSARAMAAGRLHPCRTRIIAIVCDLETSAHPASVIKVWRPASNQLKASNRGMNSVSTRTMSLAFVGKVGDPVGDSLGAASTWEEGVASRALSRTPESCKFAAHFPRARGCECIRYRTMNPRNPDILCHDICLYLSVLLTLQNRLVRGLANKQGWG